MRHGSYQRCYQPADVPWCCQADRARWRADRRHGARDDAPQGRYDSVGCPAADRR